MKSRHAVLGCALAVGLSLAPRAAQACSAPLDVRHRLSWAANGALLALADPEGRVVRIASVATGGEVLGGAVRFGARHSDFAGDGGSIVTIEEQGSETGDCSPVSITVARVVLADGARVAAGRAFDVAGVSGVRVSPSGARAALFAATERGPQVRIFELARRRAVRRLAGVAALWLGDDRLAVMRDTANVHVVRLGDRSLVQVGPVPPATVERHLVPGDHGPAGFTFADKAGDGWSLVRVRLDGPVPVLEAHAWPQAARPVSLSRDGRRFATVAEDGRRVLVAETSTGRIVADLHSSFVVTEAVLSPDGARLGLASHEVATAAEDDQAFGDASAFQPTAVQVVDLAPAGARVAASWGAPARVTFAAFR